MPTARELRINAAPPAAVGWCALATGGLLALSMSRLDWWPLAWVALVPLGFVLAARGMSRAAWSGVYLAGVGYHLATLDWLRTMYNGSGLSGDFVPAWLVAGQLGAGLFCLTVYLARRAVHVGSVPVIVALPLAWGAYECMQLLLTTLLFGGDGFVLVSLAYGQTECLTVAQAADLLGMTTISVVVATVNGAIYEAIACRGSRGSTASLSTALTRGGLVVVVVSATVAYGQSRLTEDSKTVGLKVTLIDSDDSFAVQPDNGTTTLDEQPDLWVWPELVGDRLFTRADRVIETAGPQTGVTVVFSPSIYGCERVTLRGDELQRFNTLVFADATNDSLQWYDKRSRVPFAEYVPASMSWTGVSSMCDYDRGEKVTPFLLTCRETDRDFRIGGAVCFDVISSSHFRTLAQRDNADLFVVAGRETSDDTGHLPRLMHRMARLRAIETRRPIVRNVTGGLSGVIDSQGRFQSVDVDEAGHTVAVPISDASSPYARVGNWLPAGCLSGLVLAAVGSLTKLGRRFRRRSSTAGIVETVRARRHRPASRAAFTLMELLAVVLIIGTIAAIIVPRVTTSSDRAKESVDESNRAQINSAVERWYLVEGSWPALDLSDIGSDLEYFPEGIPTNPVDGSSYTLNATTYRVNESGGGGGK